MLSQNMKYFLTPQNASKYHSMTKKLEELLNLPEIQKAMKEADVEEEYVTDDNEEEKGQLEIPDLDQAHQQKELAKGGKQYAVLDKIDAALPEVIGLDAMDKEMDNIAAEAMKTYADLMDLGMNIEARYAGRIFEVAGTNLKTALDAKAAKVDKKLKMVELQLKKSKLDRDSGELDAVESTGTIVDRNELLKNLIKK